MNGDGADEKKDRRLDAKRKVKSKEKKIKPSTYQTRPVQSADDKQTQKQYFASRTRK